MNNYRTKPKLWHCYNARSIRALWTLEEMGIDYDLEVMAFPPRYAHKGFKDLNPLGTVPYFEHENVALTESSGICLYLVEHFKHDRLRLTPEHPEYGHYLNWLFQSDATLTFPQTVYLRYGIFETPENKNPKVAQDYANWFLNRLKLLDIHLGSREFLCDNRLTIADICVGFSLYLGELLGFSEDYSVPVNQYLQRLKQRPAFIRVQEISPELDAFGQSDLTRVRA